MKYGCWAIGLALGCAWHSGTGAATFTVTNALDAGAGSLRAAIAAANTASTTDDRIEFNIPAHLSHRIVLQTALPTLSDTVTIDGYTQPGASPNTLANGDDAQLVIEIDGRNLAGLTDPAGLRVAGSGANGTVIRGLSVFGFFHTVDFTNSGGAALRVDGAADVQLLGNWIGLAADGATAIPNGTGIDLVNAVRTVVGHAAAASAAADRNIVSGNDDAINVSGTSTLDVAIKGNFIGPLPSGNALPQFDLPSGADGVKGNRADGVFVLDAVGTDIGGTSAAERNVIGGGARAIALLGAGGGSISGNSIGLGADGITPIALVNGSVGIQLNADADGNTIGGLFGGGNTLAFVTRGIDIRASRGNAIVGNLVRNLGTNNVAIDLANGNGFQDGFTPNDTNDADEGGNHLQNFPALSAAFYDGAGHLDLDGMLDMPSSPAASYLIEVFLTDACGATSETPQPKQRIGVQAISSASETFSFTLNTTPTMPYVTMTATAFGTQLDTSEYSPCFPIASDVIFADGFD